MTEAAGTPRDEPFEIAPGIVPQEAAELEYQALVAEMSHSAAALSEGRWYRGLGIMAAMLGALAAGSVALVGRTSGQGEALGNAGTIVGALALITSIFSAVINFRDPKGERDKHQLAAKQIRNLRTEIRLFRRGLGAGTPTQRDAARLRMLIERFRVVSAEAPAITDRFHDEAKRKLGSNVEYKNLRALTERSPPPNRLPDENMNLGFVWRLGLVWKRGVLVRGGQEGAERSLADNVVPLSPKPEVVSSPPVAPGAAAV